MLSKLCSNVGNVSQSLPDAPFMIHWSASMCILTAKLSCVSFISFLLHYTYVLFHRFVSALLFYLPFVITQNALTSLHSLAKFA